MQCREYKVTCFSCRYGNGNGIKVTHLAYKDNVGVFTQCGTQRLRITSCIKADLSLVHNGFFVVVKVLDRVLQRDDMTVGSLIYLIQQRSKRC